MAIGDSIKRGSSPRQSLRTKKVNSGPILSRNFDKGELPNITQPGWAVDTSGIGVAQSLANQFGSYYQREALSFAQDQGVEAQNVENAKAKEEGRAPNSVSGGGFGLAGDAYNKAADTSFNTALVVDFDLKSKDMARNIELDASIPWDQKAERFQEQFDDYAMNAIESASPDSLAKMSGYGDKVRHKYSTAFMDGAETIARTEQFTNIQDSVEKSQEAYFSAIRRGETGQEEFALMISVGRAANGLQPRNPKEFAFINTLQKQVESLGRRGFALKGFLSIPGQNDRKQFIDDMRTGALDQEFGFDKAENPELERSMALEMIIDENKAVETRQIPIRNELKRKLKEVEQGAQKNIVLGNPDELYNLGVESGMTSDDIGVMLDGIKRTHRDVRENKAYAQMDMSSLEETITKLKANKGDDETIPELSQSGLIESGNIDIFNRPQVTNPDGSISTVRSISIEEDGVQVVIPTVVGDKVVSDKEAIEHYRNTGEHLGKFKTIEDANKYAESLHNQQDAYYNSKSNHTSIAYGTKEAYHNATLGIESSSSEGDLKNVTSHAGASGPGQILEDTWDQFVQKGLIPSDWDINNKEQNAKASKIITDYYYDKYDGNVKRAAVAYHAGEGVASRADWWAAAAKVSDHKRDADGKKIPGTGMTSQEYANLIAKKVGILGGDQKLSDTDRLDVANDYERAQKIYNDKFKARNDNDVETFLGLSGFDLSKSFESETDIDNLATLVEDKMMTSRALAEEIVISKSRASTLYAPVSGAAPEDKAKATEAFIQKYGKYAPKILEKVGATGADIAAAEYSVGNSNDELSGSRRRIASQALQLNERRKELIDLYGEKKDNKALSDTSGIDYDNYQEAKMNFYQSDFAKAWLGDTSKLNAYADFYALGQLERQSRGLHDSGLDENIINMLETGFVPFEHNDQTYYAHPADMNGASPEQLEAQIDDIKENPGKYSIINTTGQPTSPFKNGELKESIPFIQDGSIRLVRQEPLAEFIQARDHYTGNVVPLAVQIDPNALVPKQPEPKNTLDDLVKAPTTPQDKQAAKLWNQPNIVFEDPPKTNKKGGLTTKDRLKYLDTQLEEKWVEAKEKGFTPDPYAVDLAGGKLYVKRKLEVLSIALAQGEITRDMANWLIVNVDEFRHLSAPSRTGDIRERNPRSRVDYIVEAWNENRIARDANNLIMTPLQRLKVLAQDIR